MVSLFETFRREILEPFGYSDVFKWKAGEHCVVESLDALVPSYDPDVFVIAKRRLIREAKANQC